MDSLEFDPPPTVTYGSLFSTPRNYRMYYHTRCSRCRFRIEYTDVQVGHHGHCKRCGRELVLPGNPFRVAMYLFWISMIVFVAYGGLRLFRYTQKVSRYSNVIIEKPEANHMSSPSNC